MEQPQQGSKIRLKFKLGKGPTEVSSSEVPTQEPQQQILPPSPIPAPPTPPPVVKSTGLKITFKKSADFSPKPPTPIVEEKPVVEPPKRKSIYVESDDEDDQDHDEDEDDEDMLDSTPRPKKEREPKEPVKRRKLFEGQTKVTLKEALEVLLQELIAKDVRGCFHDPVPADTPQYYDLIKQPMDFSTMKKKIEKNEYQYLDQFDNDVTLICNNATTYNPSSTIWYKDAKAMFTKWKKLQRQATFHLEPTVIKPPAPPSRTKTRQTPSASTPQLSPPAASSPSSPGPVIPVTPLAAAKKKETPLPKPIVDKQGMPTVSAVAQAVQRSAVQNPGVLSTAYSPVVPRPGQPQAPEQGQGPNPYNNYISNYLMWQRNPAQPGMPQSGVITAPSSGVKNIYVVPDTQYIGGLETFVEKMGPRALESVSLFLSHLRDPSLKMVPISPPLVPDRNAKPEVQVSASVLEDLKALTLKPVSESNLLEISALQTQGFDVSFLGTLAPQLKAQLMDVPRSGGEVVVDKQIAQDILDQNTQNLLVLSALQMERFQSGKDKLKPHPKEEAIAINVAKNIAELGAHVPPSYLTTYKELLTGT